MTDDTDAASALAGAQARQAETDELVTFLRHRCATLRSALHRTADELADARQRLDEQATDTERGE